MHWPNTTTNPEEKSTCLIPVRKDELYYKIYWLLLWKWQKSSKSAQNINCVFLSLLLDSTQFSLHLSSVLIKTSIKSPTYNEAQIFELGKPLFKLNTSTFYSLLASLQIKQNKQSAPYWRVSLTNLCRMVSSLRQEAWSTEEQEDGELTEGSLRLLEELYSLQHICRALQSREERVRRAQRGKVICLKAAVEPQ